MDNLCGDLLEAIELVDARVEKKTTGCSDMVMPRSILLGPKFPGVYLTNREAHCALFLLLGHTSKDIASLMGISPRTVEYYVSQIKVKIQVKRKSEISIALLKTDFIRNFRGAVSHVEL